MKRPWLITAPALMFAVLMASCGDDDGGGGTGAGGQGNGAACGAGEEADPIARFCNAVRDPFCEALFACCDDPQVLGQYGGSVAECKQIWSGCEGWLEGDGIAALLASGQTALSDAKLDTCSCKLREMSAGGAACTEPPRILLLTGCYSAFEGQVPPGEACGVATSDISFTECKDGECQAGTCAPYIESGAACTPFSGQQLCDYADGEWCQTDGATAACAPRGEIGDPCGYPEQFSMTCRSMVCGADGTCLPPGHPALCAGN